MPVSIGAALGRRSALAPNVLSRTFQFTDLSPFTGSGWSVPGKGTVSAPRFDASNIDAPMRLVQRNIFMEAMHLMHAYRICFVFLY